MPSINLLSYSASVCVCALCVFIILLKFTHDIGRESEVRALRACATSVIAYDIAHALWIWRGYGFLPLAAVGMISICFLGYFWLIYLIRRIHKARQYDKFLRVLVAIPLAVNVFIVAMSVRTGWVFRYADGALVRGPLYMMHIALASAYVAAAFFYSLFAMMRARAQSKKSEARVLLAFLICPWAALVLYAHILVFSNSPLFELALLFVIIVVFINSQESRIYTDALTGLNNRRHADEVLLAKIKNSSEKNPLYLFLTDVDKFKEINDGYGHVEGDRALKVMADALRKIGAEQRGFIARWGGDEFIMIIEHQHLVSPDDLISAIRAQLNKEAGAASLSYPMSCSVGYAVCKSPDTNMSELVNKADVMLYEDKNNHCPMIMQPRRGIARRFRAKAL